MNLGVATLKGLMTTYLQKKINRGPPKKTPIASKCESWISKQAAHSHQISQPSSWRTLLINLSTQESPELDEVQWER